MLTVALTLAAVAVIAGAFLAGVLLERRRWCSLAPLLHELQMTLLSGVMLKGAAPIPPSEQQRLYLDSVPPANGRPI